MQTLAFLQNQWVRNPERVERMIQLKGERYRQLFIRYALFAGCLTGRRIKAAFGDDIDAIAWDETSPEIGGKASSRFPADLEHMRRQVEHYQPKLLLAFGVPARDAVKALDCGLPVVYGPHPASRQADVVLRLREMAEQYRAFRAD